MEGVSVHVQQAVSVHVQQAVPHYCLTILQSFEMKNVGKYGVVERALCDRLHGGFIVCERILKLIIS